MQIVVTTLLDELYTLLSRVNQLVTLYEENDTAFIAEFKVWLNRSETLLEKNHRAQVGEISSIRAKLLSASNGVFDKTLMQFETTSGRRKRFHAYSAILLTQAQSTIVNIYDSFVPRLEQAEKFMNQILLIALQKNTFYPIWSSTSSLSEKLIQLWQSFTSDPDLVQGTRQILSVVSYPDALRIMDGTITGLKL